MEGGGQNGTFCTICLSVLWSVCVINTTTEASRTPSRFSCLVYSADRRGFMCVMNNRHFGHGAADIVYIEPSPSSLTCYKLRRSSTW